MPVVAERRPVAMRNAALSVRNLKRSLRVLETLGVDPSLGASTSLMDQASFFAVVAAPKAYYHPFVFFLL